MSNWPSKRKKSGRRHVAEQDAIGLYKTNPNGTRKSIASSRRRIKSKKALREEIIQLQNEKYEDEKKTPT